MLRGFLVWLGIIRPRVWLVNSLMDIDLDLLAASVPCGDRVVPTDCVDVVLVID